MKAMLCGFSTAMVLLLLAPAVSNAQAALTKSAETAKSASKASAEVATKATEAKASAPSSAADAVAKGAAPAASQEAAKEDKKMSEQAARDSSAQKKDVPLDPVRGDLLRYMMGGAVVLGAIAFVLLPIALWSMFARGRSFAFKSQWGGFGGGVAGWSLSPPATLLIAACVLAGLAVALLVTTAEQTDPLRQTQPEPKKSTAEPSKATK